MPSALTHSVATPARRIGLVGTYPPQVCGLATFAAALVKGLRDARNHVDVVRLDDGTLSESAGTTTATLLNGSADSVRDAAVILSADDVVIIQHEYGIYGGEDGDEVIALMEALDACSIVTLHTVPLTPTVRQRALLEAIAELADRVVVMSLTAERRLSMLYSVDPVKVAVIPHGATLPVRVGQHVHPVHGARPQLLTWGLLGPGKGIEHVIDALGLLARKGIHPSYTVAGVTHPKVLRYSGDRYRQSLIERTHDLGVAAQVVFDASYRDVPELMRFAASADVIVLPYDSRDQVTSGVLVDAIAAGRPVIATAFPHAVELLADGAGIVVPHGDANALAGAIQEFITDDVRAASMADRAAALAPTLAWSRIAAQYCSVADEIAAEYRSVAI